MLGYLSHVDTVLADPEDWTHDPWGDDADGYLYGRGAIDMKSQAAAEAVAAAHLARGRRPVARHAEGHRVADEETGGVARRQWITENRPDLVARRLPAQRGRRRGHALRRPPPVRRLRGREGHVPLPRLPAAPPAHASVPGLGDNALLKLAPLISGSASAARATT